MNGENPIECQDLAGKTIQSLKIFRGPHDGTEIMIDFIDGTSFNCTIETPPPQRIDAKLVVCGLGELDVVRTFIEE